MAHSFSAVYVHLIFSTKDRVPFMVDTAVQQDVHRYLAGIVSHQGSDPVLIGGVEDHVHALVRLGREICQADLVREMKRSSTQWLKGAGLPRFGWQSGYAAFSVSESDLAKVRSYIANQEQHHRKQTFQDEYRQLLIEHGIQLDERYLWE